MCTLLKTFTKGSTLAAIVATALAPSVFAYPDQFSHDNRFNPGFNNASAFRHEEYRAAVQRNEMMNAMAARNAAYANAANAAAYRNAAYQNAAYQNAAYQNAAYQNAMYRNAMMANAYRPPMYVGAGYPPGYGYGRPYYPGLLNQHPILSGTLIGGGVGALGGALVGSQIKKQEDNTKSEILPGAAIGAGTGAAIGAGIGLIRNASLYGRY